MLKSKWKPILAATSLSLTIAGAVSVARLAMADEEANPPAPATAVEATPADPATAPMPRASSSVQVREAKPRNAQQADVVLIHVPLDSNTFPGEWLSHNKGNQQISLFAEGTGITRESVGSHRIGGEFQILETIPKSSGESVLIVDLGLVHGFDPNNVATIRKIAETQQKQIDDLNAKKFRFVLKGLVPLGEPVNTVKVVPGMFRNVGVTPVANPNGAPRNTITTTQNFMVPATGMPTPPIAAPFVPNPAVGQQIHVQPLTPTSAGPVTMAAAAVANPYPPIAAPNGYAQPMYGPAPYFYPSSTPSMTHTYSAMFAALAPKQQQALAKLKNASSDEEKEKAREELRSVLAEIFTVDMRNRNHQASEIEDRVKKLREQYDAREKAKDEIIDLQLKLMEKQVEGLEFPMAPPGPTTIPANTFAPRQ